MEFLYFGEVNDSPSEFLYSYILGKLMIHSS